MVRLIPRMLLQFHLSVHQTLQKFARGNNAVEYHSPSSSPMIPPCVLNVSVHLAYEIMTTGVPLLRTQALF